MIVDYLLGTSMYRKHLTSSIQGQNWILLTPCFCLVVLFTRHRHTITRTCSANGLHTVGEWCGHKKTGSHTSVFSIQLTNVAPQSDKQVTWYSTQWAPNHGPQFDNKSQHISLRISFHSFSHTIFWVYRCSFSLHDTKRNSSIRISKVCDKDQSMGKRRDGRGYVAPGGERRS